MTDPKTDKDNFLVFKVGFSASLNIYKQYKTQISSLFMAYELTVNIRNS